ncbi:hypothetical protein CEXT_191921 [Caerostris extrusa]|uniref:SWI/SNF-related matrix-associated actin-dependent regulator of chromatin subfamily A containing DEAD/H box 1 homolog n=1 Tax=Caerostris extrusa TaxID=172846 RepID=A0AAV4UMB9_CAEEX|nr:hypothetical protein CEXT_191921 [Caerostris extrusa]
MCIDSPSETALKIHRSYLNELLVLVRQEYNQNFSNLNTEELPKEQVTVQTYSKKPQQQLNAFSDMTSSNGANDQLEMDEDKGTDTEYEMFCGKEQSLGKLLSAFPESDIMEVQDILVKCGWNLGKAMSLAQQQFGKSGKKRPSFSKNISDSVNSDTHSIINQNSTLTEEIVLDSSDEDIVPPKKSDFHKRKENGAPLAKKPRIISSSESEEDDPPVPPKIIKRPIQVTKQNNPAQVIKENNPVQVIKENNSVQVTKQNPVHQKSTELNSNSELSTKYPSLSIKPVSNSSTVTSDIAPIKCVSMPNLPKGLVILQVDDSSKDSQQSKPAETQSNSNAIYTKIKKQAAPLNIPATSSTKTVATNSNKSAQLIRVQASSNNVKPCENSDSSSNVASLSTAPVSKGISITPLTGVEITDSGCNGKGKSKSKSSKARIPKGKRKKFNLADDDGEEYGNDVFYDSDDSDNGGNTLTAAHSAVLKFFQESSTEELLTVPGCSKRKVDSIMKARPFSNWDDLVSCKLSNDKYLSTDLLNGVKKVLDIRNSINKLMAKCQQISIDMEDLVEDLKANKERSSDYVSKQPMLLNDRMNLTSYQMLGLNWLLLMHNQDVNGILADEMGLGKTVQAIAFLAYLKEVSMAGPHLIVVPSSVLDNWKQEFTTWWPDVSMICYHGNQEFRRELRMQVLNEEVDEFDVMITTYNMVTSSAEDRGFFKRLQFHYVVFDEAHMLKNMASQRYQHLMKIRAPRRLLLTGTPLQNNLVELMSLLIFAMPNMFSGKTDHIKQMFSVVSKTEGNKNTYEKDRIDHAKQIMKPFVLRRLKKEVLQDLPAKTDETKFCEMPEDQAEKYQSLVATFSAEFENKEKDVSSSGAGMMMQLRRAANHPLLLKRFYDDDKLKKMAKAMLKEPTHREANVTYVFEDMSVMSDFELHKLCKSYKSLKSYALTNSHILNSGKFKILDSLLPSLIEQDHRILLFSQFTMVLDIVEEYMKIKDYKFLRLDGQIPVPERQQLIDKFNSDPTIFVFLLSTRAGGLGINLTAADTVILHDIDFNPYNDKQAEDRCHRVGQRKDVSVIRLISEGTIEEGILQRAKEKLKLEQDIHNADENEENDTASVAKLLRDALGLSARSNVKS